MRQGISRVSEWIGLAMGRRDTVGHRQKRLVRLAQTVLSAAAGKGVGIVVSFVSVPLTVGYLGAERYGVWMVISTLLAWIAIADFGLGHSLTNSVSQAYGGNDPTLARACIASVFWMLMAVAAACGILFAFLWPLINWNAFFNVHTLQARSEAGPAVAVAVAICLLNLPLSVVAKTLGAYQEGALANFWLAGGNLASLGGLILATHMRGGLPWLVAAFSGIPLLVSMASFIWLFAIHKPELAPHWRVMRRHHLFQLTNLGGMFFVVQIAALLVLQTDNLIIAHYLGAGAVTPYSVTWRLFSYGILIQTLVFQSLWPAYTEALARKDISWVKQTMRLNLIGSIALTIIFSVPLIFLGAQIIHKWAGPAAVPSLCLLIWMAAWNMINGIVNPLLCVLNAAGRVRGQMTYGIVTASVNVLLTIIFVQHYGIEGVIGATVVAYLCCGVIPVIIETRNLCRRLTHELV